MGQSHTGCHSDNMDIPTILVMSILSMLFMKADSTKTCEEIVTKWTLWDEPSPGLAAHIDMPVTEEFTTLDFFNGLTEAHTGHSFNVTNEDWSGNKHPGDLIAFSMLGDYDHGGAEDITITDIALNGVVVCSN